MSASRRPDPSPAPAYRVMFVCMGNICRSPMAESVLRAKLEAAGLSSQVEVGSSGTGSWHIGDPADRRARAVLTARGYADGHIARQFQPEWFHDLDLVLALDEQNLRALRRLAPGPDAVSRLALLRAFDPAAESLEVPDPYYGGGLDFDAALTLIEEACDGLVEHLRTTLP